MRRTLPILLSLLLMATTLLSAQTPSRSIVVDEASFRPVQSDALTGIAIDPIGLDGSKRPCTRLKMRINRMTREEIGELSFRLRGGVIDLRKQIVAHEGNGLIIEMTAHKNTVFYLQHPRFGMSNEVTISTEGNKEYYIEASLNQLYPITIASNTADAEVYIDGTMVGRTNADCVLVVEEVLPGEHTLRLVYGGASKEQTINVNSGNVYFKQEVDIKAAQPQYAVFQVTPATAVIMLDGSILQSENGTATKFLKPGRYQYTISAPDYHTERGEFTMSGSKVVKSITLRPNFGHLQITGNDASGATLIIDGKVIGTLPLATLPTLSNGIHNIQIIKAKYKPYATTVTIGDNSTAMVTPILQPNFARLTFTVEGDAEIWINDHREGRGSCQCDLELGTYRIETRKEGCRTWSRSLDVTSTVASKIALTAPQPIVGSLNITSSPMMASVNIDGQKVGETPLLLDNIAIGTHKVEIVLNGYATWSRDITITEGQTATLDATLSKAAAVTTSTTASSGTGISDFCDMVFVEGGTFTMGATSEQGSEADDEEKPTHSVTLSDFYIGKYEVTQAQWKSIMGSNPSKWKGDNLPVESVSWNDIQEFIQKLNQKTGKKYRLPTEAEWEYAARGGAKSQGYKYSGSNHLDSVAWYWDNSGNKTHPVGQKVPNELGIYDMSGNVYESCQDRYDDYSSASQTNPTGPSSGSYRVLRGGSWNNYAEGCRVSSRTCNTPSSGGSYNGFRLAHDAITKPSTVAKEIYQKGKSLYYQKRYAEAIPFIREAAEKGYAEAQFRLGWCYRNGYGLTKSDTEAVKWYRKAAEQGHAQAQTNLGFCYRNGIGVTKDYTEAIKLYRKAAEQGNAMAQSNLGNCYYGGRGVAQDYTEAVKWYRKAAEEGNFKNAQYHLGLCYLYGHGVAKDRATAIGWLRKAAKQGYTKAKDKLKELGESAE